MSTQKDSPTKRNDEISIGLALSGGGSRAMAFHLGCMRSLHKHGILERVKLLSSVSGGSVIAALYAYNDDSFEEFESRVRDHLRKGFLWGSIRHTFLSIEAIRIFFAILLSIVAFVCRVLCLPLIPLNFIKFLKTPLGKILSVVNTPPLRFASRSTAFERFLRRSVFGDRKLQEVKRENLKVIINATELRTETAFRFGSDKTSCWRYGDVADHQLLVSKAVATSAAYPPLLPAFDEVFLFSKNDTVNKRRVILTDGGVYDNLGVTPILPGRSSKHTSHSDAIDFIICSEASSGLPQGKRIPNRWTSRMVATFETIHRRTHAQTYSMLHRLNEVGEISGFLLPYLGQDDNKLPFAPDNLVRRQDIRDYPIDFNPMHPINIELLSERGEQLTNILIETYHPKLTEGICGK